MTPCKFHQEDCESSILVVYKDEHAARSAKQMYFSEKALIQTCAVGDDLKHHHADLLYITPEANDLATFPVFMASVLARVMNPGCSIYIRGYA